ncbi:MAG: hypothetical protein J6Y75_00255 [Spirochaetaceae bacterium]|nr:hypothetical protein [Spirochaetaceae bacterium]
MSLFATYCLMMFITLCVGFLGLRWLSLNLIECDVTGRYFSGNFISIIIVLLVIFAIICVIAYFTIKPLEKILDDIKRKKRNPDKADIKIANKVLVHVNMITFIVVLIGFVMVQFFLSLKHLNHGDVTLDSFIFINLLATFTGLQFAVLDTVVVKKICSAYYKELKIYRIDDDVKVKSVTFQIFLTVLCMFCNVSFSMYCVSKGLISLPLGLDSQALFREYVIKGIQTFIFEILLCMPAVIIQLNTLHERISYTKGMITQLGQKSDLSKHIEISMYDNFGLLIGSVNALIDTLGDMTGELKKGTASVAESADVLSQVTQSSGMALNIVNEHFDRINAESENQTSLINALESDIKILEDGAKEVGDKIEQQSASMAQSTESFSYIAKNITSVSQTTREADSISDKLKNESQFGNESLANAINSIKEIQDVSGKVQAIVDVIQNIAAQTNLLSMNAAIEAAHAGNYGAGFAVVAGEVRSLANSSSKSAADIKKLIDDMVTKINLGVNAITAAVESFKSITEDVNANRSLVQNISLSMVQQQENVTSVTRAMEESVEIFKSVQTVISKLTESIGTVRNTMSSVKESSGNVENVIKQSIGASDSLKNAIELVAMNVTENTQAVEKMQDKIKIYN